MLLHALGREVKILLTIVFSLTTTLLLLEHLAAGRLYFEVNYFLFTKILLRNHINEIMVMSICNLIDKNRLIH